MYLFIEVNQDRRAELSISDLNKNCVLMHENWACDRQLSKTFLLKLDDFLKRNNLNLQSLRGLGVFAGPAGFTDLRIVHTIANALAYGLQIPIVSSGDRSWRQICWSRLKGGEDSKIIKPFYGRQASITPRRK